MFRLIHSISLGNDPPLASHNPTIFSLPPGNEKFIKSPPRYTKSPDNSNVLHMCNNSNYTDFRTAYKMT